MAVYDLQLVSSQALCVLQHREKRPRYDGSRGDSHKYHPELSGKSSPPDNMDPGSLSLTISCYAFGGFCAVRGVLPLTQSVKNDITTITVEGNGMNAEFYETVHCVAAEPHAAFLRIGVYDDGDEIAYGTAVLARLRAGYRIFQMRGTLGPRIELCYLLVHISFGSEPNLWPTRFCNTRECSQPSTSHAATAPSARPLRARH
eukprot:3972663-Prymnesium_polylepis.1